MKSILITGITSFIGRNILNDLLMKEYLVYGVVRKNSTKISLLPKNNRIKIIECDMSNYALLKNKVKHIDAIIHLAWNGTRGKDRNDQSMQENNYAASIDLMNIVSDLGAKVFISAGSQAEYGPHNGVITEETECTPLTKYGENKLKFYNEALPFFTSRGIDFKEPRFFSLYGPGDYSGTMIVSILTNMLNNEICQFTDCQQFWNFLHIKDAVRGIASLIEEKCDNGAYNFGSSDTRRLKEFILEMAKQTKTRSKLEFGAIPHNDSGTCGIRPDISKMLKATHWKPEVTFAKGIQSVIESLKE